MTGQALWWWPGWAGVQVLFPPGCFLEVIGKPGVVYEGGMPLVTIPLQISSPQATTIEKSRASRKTNLFALVTHSLLEVCRVYRCTCTFVCVRACLHAHVHA